MKNNNRLLRILEGLEQERKRDEHLINLDKKKFIHEIKGWKKEEFFKIEEKKKLSFADKIKKMFGK